MRFLHIEDNPQDAELVRLLLLREWQDLRIDVVETRGGYEEALKGERPDLILSDFSLPAFDGLTALSMARGQWPQTPFVFLSGTMGEEVAVGALKDGATDYILKDRLGRLVPALRSALAQAEEQMRRSQAEEALRESRERFQQITENVTDLIAMLDLDGHRVYTNPAYETVFGRTTSLNGTDSFVDIHPDDRDRVHRIFDETIRTGKGRRAEYRVLLRDGTVRFIESQSGVVRDRDGKVINVLFVARDVTERRQAEEIIREQASLLDKARDAICVAGLDQRVTYWNASAEHLFGWSTPEAIGASLLELLFNQDTVHHQEVVAQLMAEGQWQGELRPKTKRQQPITLESRWTLVTDAKGRPRSVLIINTDITERKKLEVQYLRAQRMESIGTLAGGIAHDLNNVLTPVLIASQMLQMQIAGKEEKQLLNTIEKSALHGASLIKQVLLFARGAEGEHTALQLRHLVAELSRLLRETLPRSIEIHTDVERDLNLVKGDSTQLSQVLMNLCVNSRDAMPLGGRIKIQAHNVEPDEDFFRTHPDAKRGPYVLVSVEDTGTGIPPELIDRIFDPFFTTKDIGKGTGLGLSTVLGIVKGHGGVLNVTSELNKGTRFDIYLPTIPSEKPVRQVESRPSLPRGHGEAILVIDDEGYVRDVLAATLKYCGYRSYLAPGCEVGLETYRRHAGEIVLVVVDMMMPGVDGITTMERLREINPKLKLIAMSGMLDAELLDGRRLPEEVPFLRKPIAAEDLLTKIADVLAEPVA